MEARQELEMRGIGAAPGIVAGPVLLLKADDEPLPEYAVAAEDVPREMLRLEAALIETRRQLDDEPVRGLQDAQGIDQLDPILDRAALGHQAAFQAAHHALDHLLAEGMDGADPAEGRHGPTKLVCLGGREPGCDDGDLHRGDY